jgi:hypothetical protein
MPNKNRTILNSPYIEQGCQIFLDTKHQNGENYTTLPLNYQMAINMPKSRNIPSPKGQIICQPFPIKGTQKFTQIGIFGLKIYHLATLTKRSDA